MSKKLSFIRFHYKHSIFIYTQRGSSDHYLFGNSRLLAYFFVALML